MRYNEVSGETELKCCFAIRDEVFVQEQSVLPEEEWDGKEDEARHFLAYVDNQPAATLRVRLYNEPVGESVLSLFVENSPLDCFLITQSPCASQVPGLAQGGRHQIKDLSTGASNKTAKIERVATLKKFRGRGVGNALMEFVIKKLSDEGIKNFIIEAQVQALPFYENLGFVAFGEEFLDARIPHRKMRLQVGI